MRGACKVATTNNPVRWLFLLLAINVLSSCSGGKNDYQINNLLSPDQSYKAVFTIEEMDGGHEWWNVYIYNKRNEKEFELNKKLYVGHLNIYWVWDKENNLLIENSDDGSRWVVSKNKEWFIKEIQSTSLEYKSFDFYFKNN